MSRFAHLVLSAGMLLTVACAAGDTERVKYLNRATGKATQADIIQQLGKPQRTQVTPDGGALWVYEVYQVQPGNQPVGRGIWCDEYRLEFTRQAVLQAWTHEAHFHPVEVVLPCRPNL